MIKILLRLIPAFILWGIFAYVVFYIPYPESITQADILQLSSFFISLFLALLFTFNILLRAFALSGTLSLGIIFLLILKALDSFNFVTGTLLILAIGLLVSYFRKNKSLTKVSKLSKISGLKKE